MRMHFMLCVLSLTSVWLFGCRPSSPDATSTPLSFYVVSEEKIEAGQFIDAPDFPKLGYISAKPDLVIARLDAVGSDVSRRQDIMVDKDGKETVMPLQTKPALILRMQSEDAKKFTALTEQAIGKRVLIMLGEMPLMAPTVRAPIQTPSFVLTLGDKTDHKKIEAELQRLVR
jgi:preprotein translocase subunit SecD